MATTTETALEKLRAKGLAGETYRLPDGACSCGCREPHIIARVHLADGKRVQFWSDGDVTEPFGFALPGIGRGRSAWADRANAHASRVVRGDACMYTLTELVRALKIARKLCRESGWTCDDAIRNRVRQLV